MKIKSIFLVIALPIIIDAHTCKKQQLTPKNLDFDPVTTLIISDLDDVVIKHREYNFLSWLAYPSNWGFAFTVYKVKNKYNLHDPKEILQKIIELYPKYAKKAEDFQKKLTQAQPNQGTITVLTKLHNKGYTIIAGSNMGKSTYLSLREQNTLPQNLFSRHFYFVKTKKQNKKANGDYHEKPDVQYFLNLKQYAEKKYPGRFKTFIFFDDKKHNINGARKAGLETIHFKNAQQLEKKFKHFGLQF